MEKTWNHKQIRLLLGGDGDAVEQFLAQFVPVIYTWSYYQVGADADIALDLTGDIFSQAIQKLPSFDPAQETLFEWLKKQAALSRDEVLQVRQMKPQRPWAWSQLPDEVLCGLSRFRSELLDENILSNVYVHEIVQAALVELNATDRQLLVHRFCNLDTIENIAEEMNFGIEDIQNRLYRSRHSFKREFFKLLAAANNGFAESGDTGDIELQDTNLEKLLSTTTIYQTLDNAQMDTIREQLMQAAGQAALSLPQETPHSKIIITVAAIFIFIAVIAGIYWQSRNDSADAPPTPASQTDNIEQASEQKDTTPKVRQRTQDDIDGKELKQVFALGQEGNIDALLEVLKSGRFASQAAAAHFLGKLADPSAIDLLRQAEEQWYPNASRENPFADAIGQILTRFPDAAVAVVEDPKPEPEEKPDTKKEIKKPVVPAPSITGLVSDFSNQPVANAVVELTENPLFSNVGGRKIATVRTTPNGQYQFSEIDDQCVFLTCRVSAGSPIIFTRSLWSQKGSLCVANIGGKPVLTGTVIIDGLPLAGRKLYLSDTLDINHASFRQETMTDADGNFTFSGVFGGVYSVMHEGLDNRLHRLGTIEMAPRDIFNVNLNIETVTVILPDQPNISNAILDYTLDAPNNLNQIRASLIEGAVLQFLNVIPGSYVLRVKLDNGVWLQQNIEVEKGPAEQMIQPDLISEETSILRGRFLNATPVDLFLTTINQDIHIDIAPGADGSYELESIPADIYSLAAFIKGQLIEFTQIDLQSEAEMTLDIDPAEMMLAYSPLNVVVTDAAGIVLSDAQIWLSGGDDIVTASSTGQGAFLAAAAGSYTLSIAHSDYPTKNREVILKPSSLIADTNSENTLVIRLGTVDTP
ncbi:MAG: hypothetical protein ACYSO4_04540 [Planctomycetota bacterium]|jgi:DNA-directed RNA polymerase specialized sigma24 family protein/protocatechuate 3,4-dioxygenase beta subunit